jgi:hypothetical protein
MSSALIARYVTPWKYQRERREAERVRALKVRDGDACARCRRPIRFDLPAGHDRAPKVEPIGGAADGLDDLCLCHVRCNAAGADHTLEVTDRVRRKNEAALFARPRRIKKAG